MASMKEISDHFGVAVPTMHEYVKKHLSEINIDGEHAAQRAGKWVFDSVAIKRLEELRGFGIAGVIDELESQKIKDRDIMIANLQTALLTAQQDTIKALQRVAEAETERRLISETSIKEKEELAVLRERAAAQSERLKELEQLKKEKDEMESAIVELIRQNDELERKLRPWWKRLFE